MAKKILFSLASIWLASCGLAADIEAFVNWINNKYTVKMTNTKDIVAKKTKICKTSIYYFIEEKKTNSL